MGITFVSNVKREDYWESNIKVIERCSLVSPLTVKINIVAKIKIDALMEKYKKREWLAYLIGDKEKNYVKDIIFPKQIATTAHVTPKEFPQNKNLIGVIHSHHTMGHNFSNTDAEFINQNHHMSIVVSSTGYSGTIRTNTPCGCVINVPLKIEIDYGVNVDIVSFLTEVEGKMLEPEKPAITGPKYEYTPSLYYGSYSRLANRRGSIVEIDRDLTEDELDEMIRREIDQL